MTKTLWVDGWACNSDFKKKELSIALNTDLTLIPFETWIQDSNNPTSFNYDGFDNIILWSTACLGPIDFINSKTNFILLFPAVDFCGDQGWNSTAINRMQRNISKGKAKQTLEQFSDLLGNPNKHEKEQWTKTACQEPSLLVQGLELLKSKLDTKLPESTKLILGNQDSLCKPYPIKLYAEQNKLTTISLESTHWPFHPKVYDEIKKILAKND